MTLVDQSQTLSSLQMREGVIDYFPINRALDLNDTNGDDEEKLNELADMMKAMMDKIGSMEVGHLWMRI